MYVVIFLSFAFGYMIYWTYLIIKSSNYLSIIFTIPFYLLLAYFVRKNFFKNNKTTKSKKSSLVINPEIVVGGFLVGITLLIGIVCLYIRIKETYKLSKVTKGYDTINGYFADYDIYNSDEDGTTYKLIYTYEVKGKKYTVATDYGVSSIPDKNSIREVKYDPSSPNKSILSGTNDKNFIIYFGGFFTLGAIAFILVAMKIKGVFDKVKIDVVGFYFGFVIFITETDFILIQNSTTTSFIETIKSPGFWIIIPLLLIVAGLFQMIKCLFFKQLNTENR